jgi:GAF domain-containing protein/HAMP domain-containing protein
LLSVVGAAVIALALTQVISAPILSLTKTADQLAKGDLTARAQITTEDEIGNLGKTLNIMATQLQNLVNNLEKQVANRTRDLENRAAHLQASAEVARDVTSEQQLDDLLNRATTLIQDRFGYYHVGIYLKDSKSEYAFLAATNDTPGKKLLETQHRYRIDPDSNVGYAVMVGESLLASVEDPTTQPNYHPLLQNSMSQMVLPLHQGNQVVGAIDIHSTNPTAFLEEDIQIYQILADQIAISVQKAKYQEAIQDTLDELEAAYGVFTRESWRKFLQTRKNIAGFRYNQRQVEEVYTSPENVVRAWFEGQKISETKESPRDPKTKFTTLAIPMKVRGEVIGVLNVDFETDQVPADTTNLINEIADRLSLIIENARLIETAQRTAEREQLSSHISNQIRQSLDMDMILRIAVQEIGESLGLAEVELRLGKSNGGSSTAQPSDNGKTQAESS